MDNLTHRARITGPVSYQSGSGRTHNIPIGPCLIESAGEHSIEVIWGDQAQRCVALPIEEIKAAQDQGCLVFLD